MIVAPSFDDFARSAKKGNLTAVYVTIPADLETPVSSFLKTCHDSPHTFLLESAEQGEKVGRFSIIGLKQRMVVTARAGEPVVDQIQKQLAKYKLSNPADLPGFCGGFVGYLSYENVEHFEKIALKNRKGGPSVPDAIFFLTEDLLIFDHFRKTLSVVSLVETSGKNLKAAYHQAVATIQKYIAKLQRPLAVAKAAKPSPVQMKSNVTPAAFHQKVQKIREYVKAGDCIQVVLSQRFTLPAPKDDFRIYRALRSINPSPYMFYFRSGSVRLIGSSPEMLVKKEGRTAEVRPIAGTRPRGKNQAEDSAFEENLKASRKEMAEHLMLVDLGRNDLGRVCEFNSVQVKKFARVERYSHVMHLVSDVAGKLKSGKTAFDLLKATFPAGTVSGAPKIRAMQIINELEPERRGPYAGCLGYFSFNQDMDMCITIRTLVHDGKKLYLQAGAGIVKDSSPEREFEETVNKAKALVKAISAQELF